MYFAIAYEIWPKLTGHEARSLTPIRVQLWLWFIGIIVTSFPWHILGLLGQPRRVASFDFGNPDIAYWGPWTTVSAIGGFIMLAGAGLFLWNLAFQFRGAPVPSQMAYAVAVHPPRQLPRALNGFGLWNALVLFLMVVAYGYPIAQFFFMDSYPAQVQRLDGDR
jgi:cytochrome c oxidase subunit 1